MDDDAEPLCTVDVGDGDNDMMFMGFGMDSGRGGGGTTALDITGLTTTTMESDVLQSLSQTG